MILYPFTSIYLGVRSVITTKFVIDATPGLAIRSLNEVGNGPLCLQAGSKVGRARPQIADKVYIF